MAARARHVRKCLLSPSQDGQCPTRSAEQDHGRLYCLNWALRVLEGCNKEGERGRHVRTFAAWLCLVHHVCQASRPRRTLRSSAAVDVSIQAVFKPSLSSFCDFPTSPYLPVLPSDPGRWRSHLCCMAPAFVLYLCLEERPHIWTCQPAHTSVSRDTGSWCAAGSTLALRVSVCIVSIPGSCAAPCTNTTPLMIPTSGYPARSRPHRDRREGYCHPGLVITERGRVTQRKSARS